jgi:hypothetical protein
MSLNINDLELVGVPNICYSDNGDGTALSTGKCSLLIVESDDQNLPAGSIDFVEFLENFSNIVCTDQTDIINDIKNLDVRMHSLENKLCTFIKYTDYLKNYNINESNISLDISLGKNN